MGVLSSHRKLCSILVEVIAISSIISGPISNCEAEWVTLHMIHGNLGCRVHQNRLVPKEHAALLTGESGARKHWLLEDLLPAQSS